MQNKELEIRFFDEFAGNSYDVFNDSGYRKLISFFAEYVKPAKGETLVDLGCGTGAFIKYLMEYGLKITGMDISDRCIGYARSLYPGIDFMSGDIENSKLGNESYDIVFLGGVLHHFPEPGGCIREVYRILKPGGRFFGFDPNGENPAQWLYRNRKSPLYSDKGKTSNEISLERKVIYGLLEKNNFEEIKITATSGITYKYLKSNVLKKALYFYNLFELIFDRTPFSGKYGSFLVYYGKKNAK